MALQEKTLSLDRFLQLPEEKPALEYIDGEVSRKVSPQVWHSRLQVALLDHINRVAYPARRAFAFSELRSTFADSSRVPALFSALRMP
jgi:Uma2 family endonuclease